MSGSKSRENTTEVGVNIKSQEEGLNYYLQVWLLLKQSCKNNKASVVGSNTL